jgi:hypothetical protein
MRYLQASRQESRLPASRDNSGSPNLMCGKCWHQNLEELQKANNRVPWLKRGHIKSLPSHGESSSPLGSANDFRHLAEHFQTTTNSGDDRIELQRFRTVAVLRSSRDVALVIIVLLDNGRLRHRTTPPTIWLFLAVVAASERGLPPTLQGLPPTLLSGRLGATSRLKPLYRLAK